MSSILATILLSLSISSKLQVKSERPSIHKVATIQTVYGDIYDCTDVYKQHSLTHPALQEHKIKMRPSREILATFQSQRKSSFVNKLWKSKKGCPKGTIPIRRSTTTNDHKNLGNSSRDHSPSQSLNSDDRVDFAGIYTKPGKKFYSVAAYINLYNPKLHYGGQYSSAVVFIEGGGASNLNQIQVGWTVNPTLYGDYNTRLYSAWSDPRVGWWLAVGPNYDFIGYWPVTLFNSIQDHADSLRFGGQVFTPSANDIRPQMGSGIFKNGEYDQTCYIRRIRVADETHRYLYAVDNSYISGTDSRCYYEGDQSFKNENTGYSFVFGGKGGRDGSQCFFD
ncbi:hypothetical protein Salat_1254500 [Sesamum alatum]|uniref:Neprosin PEP catalytic domain-containing protein n=1 Tax=Sesamum alatum TaxID=300844 RepID=A0AAE1YG36_9LAMI|nr:hypothetical protein Salat_1254500 [Sesamum alatum]